MCLCSPIRCISKSSCIGKNINNKNDLAKIYVLRCRFSEFITLYKSFDGDTSKQFINEIKFRREYNRVFDNMPHVMTQVYNNLNYKTQYKITKSVLQVINSFCFDSNHQWRFSCQFEWLAIT